MHLIKEGRQRFALLFWTSWIGGKTVQNNLHNIQIRINILFSFEVKNKTQFESPANTKIEKITL